jgi:hypothetical protein
MKSRLIGMLVIGALQFMLLFAGNGTPAHATDDRSVSFEGITFTYDASIASDVVATSKPEQPVPGGSGTWLARPAHIRFAFVDYKGGTQFSPQPEMLVFPIRADYKSLAPDDKLDMWLPRVQALQSLLAQKPDLRAEIEGQLATQGRSPSLPYLPPINAATMSVGKQTYLNFKNGSGIRYLVHITQDASPPDRDGTLYTYQGITNDGRYYVAVSMPAFPTSDPSLPNLFNSPDDSRGYYLGLIDTLNGITNQDYTPDLDKLDEMVQSLLVTPSGVSMPGGMPPTGEESLSSQVVWLASVAALMILAGLLVRGTKQKVRSVE